MHKGFVGAIAILGIFLLFFPEEGVMAEKEDALFTWLRSMRQGMYRPFTIVGSEKLDLTYRDPETGAETGVSAMQYDLEFTYLGIEGRPLTGEARLFCPEEAGNDIPLIVDIHYEMGSGGADRKSVV